MDERTKNHTRAHREWMRSRAPHARREPVRVDASSHGRAVRLYRGTLVKDSGLLRIVVFLLAIIASLAAWGVVVYVAMRFIRNYG
jgi:hypothetical protein